MTQIIKDKAQAPSTWIVKDKAQAPRTFAKRLPILLLGLMIILGDIAIYRYLRAHRTAVAERNQPALNKSAVATKPKIKTVTTLGRLEPGGKIVQISISTAAEGNRIEQLLIREGDVVAQGDVIAVLDSRDRLEAAFNQSQEKVKIALANIAQIKAGAKDGEIQAQQATLARIQGERDSNIDAQLATVSRMQAEVNNAQLEYQRYQELYQEGVISASEKDSKSLTLATTREQLAEARANLMRIKSSHKEQIVEAQATLNKISEVRPVDVAIAEAELGETQAAVRTAQAELNRAYIKSPQAGTIIKVQTRPGEVIASDSGIAKIGQTDEMYAIAEVYESDIQKIKPGQKATITSSALAEKLTGKIERIGLEVERQEVVNTDPTSNIDAKVVEVKVKLDSESSQKVAGLTNLLVNVRIEI